MARRVDDYSFLKISDVIGAVNQKVNLTGFVVEFSIPKQTRGTDCFCRLKIVDDSCQSPGISVCIFAEDMEKLPRIEPDGAIIQFFHVVIKANNGEMYALFNKKFSSFALFEGKSSTNFIPYQVSPKYHSRDDDKKFIASLRTWLLNYQLDAGTRNSLSLSEIKELHTFDLVCKILHVCEVSKDNWMLFLWDGTDTPPLSIRTKLQDEMENPLPLQLEPRPLPREVLCTFPSMGTILRVPIDQEKEKLELRLIDGGRWMKFSKIICKEQSGLWRGILLASTRLQYLSNEDDIVIQRQRFYDEKASSKWEKIPLSSFPWTSHVTETDHEHVPFVTLMDVLTHAEVTAKFKGVVRVLATYPWKVEDFHSPQGIYRIRLTLEDPTARIHAFLYAEDGEKFFDGHPSIDMLTRKRNKLLGVTETEDGQEDEMAPRNPPWIQCCLKSYYLDKGDAWGSRRFRIFDTKMGTKTSENQ